METLQRISAMTLMKIPRFSADSFQQDILNNLHLEFFLSSCRALITPDMRYLTTGAATPEEEAQLTSLVERHGNVLHWMKEYLVYQLSLYSSLVESNSYYITLNNNLIITRFVDVPDHPEDFEVKLYTIGADELPHNYRDKIYIGRDFISLTRLHREHFGLKHIRNSLTDQVEKLRHRFKEMTPAEDLPEIESEYLDEISELVFDFREEADLILEHFPVDISPRTLDHKALTDANRRFRELKHILTELEETARELESVLFDRNMARPVRYATKFRKDLTNYINYIMSKINGRITDAVNGIHI
ncbi:MAG: hypothetical protein K1X75_10655 [Leptospirales bacterium]|nr:hypothetical protein [Leptospirales bacterium]